MNKLSPTDSLGSLIRAPEGPYQTDMYFETVLQQSGHRIIAGVDEAGRGPLAGPVVAAAVILDKNNIPDGLSDSKKLSLKSRNDLFRKIIHSSEVSIATVNAKVIDEINIRQATLLGMNRAVNALGIQADWHIIDGRDVPTSLKHKATAIIKGDGRSSSIAAASIVAKVTRDAIMTQNATPYPEYGFELHKGYGTQSHRIAIEKFGPCSLHRFSFAPIRHM